jgi:hypothetical protein
MSREFWWAMLIMVLSVPVNLALVYGAVKLRDRWIHRRAWSRYVRYLRQGREDG